MGLGDFEIIEQEVPPVFDLNSSLQMILKLQVYLLDVKNDPGIELLKVAALLRVPIKKQEIGLLQEEWIKRNTMLSGSQKKPAL